MNAADRKKVSALTSTLEGIKAQIEDVGSLLRDLADAEQEKFDNMSEGLQQGDQGQAIEAAASALADACVACESGDVESALSSLGEIEA